MCPQFSSERRVCVICGRKFWAQQYRIKAGRALFCSRLCGNRAIAKKRAVPFADRFFARIGNKSASGCIIWTGRLNENGYGVITQGGRDLLAHRVSHELMIGTIPDGHHVCHRCDNPPCIHPAHLFTGTPADNLADMRSKSREARGEQHGISKLTADAVREIRRRYQDGETVTSLAAEFSMSHGPIWCAIHRKTWKHVS